MDNKIYLDLKTKFGVMSLCKNADTKGFYDFVNHNYPTFVKIISPAPGYSSERQSGAEKINRNSLESHFDFWLKELSAVLGYNKEQLLDFLGFFSEENSGLTEVEGFIRKATTNLFSLRKMIFGILGKAVEKNQSKELIANILNSDLPNKLMLQLNTLSSHSNTPPLFQKKFLSEMNQIKTFLIKTAKVCHFSADAILLFFQFLESCDLNCVSETQSKANQNFAFGLAIEVADGFSKKSKLSDDGKVKIMSVGKDGGNRGGISFSDTDLKKVEAHTERLEYSDPLVKHAFNLVSSRISDSRTAFLLNSEDFLNDFIVSFSLKPSDFAPNTLFFAVSRSKCRFLLSHFAFNGEYALDKVKNFHKSQNYVKLLAETLILALNESEKRYNLAERLVKVNHFELFMWELESQCNCGAIEDGSLCHYIYFHLLSALITNFGDSDKQSLTILLSKNKSLNPGYFLNTENIWFSVLSQSLRPVLNETDGSVQLKGNGEAAVPFLALLANLIKNDILKTQLGREKVLALFDANMDLLKNCFLRSQNQDFLELKPTIEAIFALIAELIAKNPKMMDSAENFDFFHNTIWLALSDTKYNGKFTLLLAFFYSKTLGAYIFDREKDDFSEKTLLTLSDIISEKILPIYAQLAAETPRPAPNLGPNQTPLLSITKFLILIASNATPPKSRQINQKPAKSAKKPFFQPKTQIIFQNAFAKNADAPSLIQIEASSPSVAVLIKNLFVLGETTAMAQPQKNGEFVGKIAKLCFLGEGGERESFGSDGFVSAEGWLETLRCCVGKDDGRFVWMGGAEGELFFEFLLDAFTDFDRGMGAVSSFLALINSCLKTSHNFLADRSSIVNIILNFIDSAADFSNLINNSKLYRQNVARSFKIIDKMVRESAAKPELCRNPQLKANFKKQFLNIKDLIGVFENDQPFAKTFFKANGEIFECFSAFLRAYKNYCVCCKKWAGDFTIRFIVSDLFDAKNEFDVCSVWQKLAQIDVSALSSFCKKEVNNIFATFVDIVNFLLEELNCVGGVVSDKIVFETFLEMADCILNSIKTPSHLIKLNLPTVSFLLLQSLLEICLEKYDYISVKPYPKWDCILGKTCKFLLQDVTFLDRILFPGLTAIVGKAVRTGTFAFTEQTIENLRAFVNSEHFLLNPKNAEKASSKCFLQFSCSFLISLARLPGIKAEKNVDLGPFLEKIMGFGANGDALASEIGVNTVLFVLGTPAGFQSKGLVIQNVQKFVADLLKRMNESNAMSFDKKINFIRTVLTTPATVSTNDDIREIVVTFFEKNDAEILEILTTQNKSALEISFLTKIILFLVETSESEGFGANGVLKNAIKKLFVAMAREANVRLGLPSLCGGLGIEKILSCGGVMDSFVEKKCDLVIKDDILFRTVQTCRNCILILRKLTGDCDEVNLKRKGFFSQNENVNVAKIKFLVQPPRFIEACAMWLQIEYILTRISKHDNLDAIKSLTQIEVEKVKNGPLRNKTADTVKLMKIIDYILSESGKRREI